jgi:hypothetical protein
MKVLEAFMAFVVTCRFEEPHIHGNLGIKKHRSTRPPGGYFRQELDPERCGLRQAKEVTMANWLKCTAKRGGGVIHVNLENAVSVYWSERDKATVIAFIGGEKDAVLIEEKPDQIFGGK